MGIIKEPEGVDFIIKSRPLTKKEEVALSAYIAAYKNQRNISKVKKQSKRKTKSKEVNKASK